MQCIARAKRAAIGSPRSPIEPDVAYQVHAASEEVRTAIDNLERFNDPCDATRSVGLILLGAWERLRTLDRGFQDRLQAEVTR